MALVCELTPCLLCDKPVMAPPSDCLGFGCLHELLGGDFEKFMDNVAHVSCLSRWERRDEFLRVWNAALRKHFRGKQLFVGNDGLVRYTDEAKWEPRRNFMARMQSAEGTSEPDQQMLRRRNDLADRMTAAREKAIRLGFADGHNVDKIIYEMPLKQFLKHFGQLHVSRAYFK
jgi:hypothetical protein